MNLETVVADSVVYEPSREVMPISEGIITSMQGRRPFLGFGDQLNMPGGNLAGIGPVESSPVLPHTSDPPVPSGVAVSESTHLSRCSGCC